MRLSLALLAGLFLAAPSPAADDPFREARELVNVHREKDAFLRLLAVPGGEPYAAALAKDRAQAFLDILVRAGRDLPVERRRLVEGELRLALGQRDRARACFGEAGAALAVRDENSYPLEPPEWDWTRHDPGREGRSPFPGTGSQRDNWLLRRLIVLEAWEEAGREWARVEAIHRRYSSPHAVRQE